MAKPRKTRVTPQLAKLKAAAAAKAVTVRAREEGWSVVPPDQVQDRLRNGEDLRLISPPLLEQYRAAQLVLEEIEQRIAGSARWAVTFYAEGIIL